MECSCLCFDRYNNKAICDETTLDSYLFEFFSKTILFHAKKKVDDLLLEHGAWCADKERVRMSRMGLSCFIHCGRELLTEFKKEIKPHFDLAKEGSIVDMVRFSHLPAEYMHPNENLMPPCMLALSRKRTPLSPKELIAKAGVYTTLERDSIGDTQRANALGESIFSTIKPLIDLQLE